MEVIMNTTVAKFIEHHGTKGMHWGVRNKRSSSRKQQYVTRLSDEQLRTRVARMELEKKYASLSGSSRGEAFAKKFLAENGKQVASMVVRGAAISVINSLLKKSFGEKVSVGVLGGKMAGKAKETAKAAVH